MRRMIVVFVVLCAAMVGRAEEQTPRPPAVAYLSMDDIHYDEKGKPNGWRQVFSVHFSTNNARYWPEPGKPVDYKVPEESTRGCRLAIKTLAINVVTEQYVPARKPDQSRRLQFGYSDGMGTSISISGLYLYNDREELPQEVQTLLRFVHDALRTPNQSLDDIGEKPPNRQ